MSLYETEPPRSLGRVVPLEFVMTEALFDISRSSQTAARHLGDLTSIASAGFENLCAALSRGNSTLDRLERLSANPLSTQADELYRRGCHALNSGWLPEAEQDLRRAADIDPYQPMIPFALGLCLARQARAADAAAAFERCVRYSLRDARLIAAHAIILGAEAWAEAGQPDRQRSLLVEHAPRFPDCPELQLATALVTNDERWMKQALAVAPELTPYALRSGARLDRIAADLAADPQSKLAQLLALRHLLDQQTSLPPLAAVAADPQGALRSFGDFLSTQRGPLEQHARRTVEAAAAARADAATQSVAPPAPPRLRSRAGGTVLAILAALTLLCYVVAGWALATRTWDNGHGALFGLMIVVGFPLLVATVVVYARHRPRALNRRAINGRNDSLYRDLVAQHEASVRRAAEARSWLGQHADEVSTAERVLDHLQHIDSTPPRLRLDPRTGATRR